MAEFFRIVRVRPNGSEQRLLDIPITADAVQRLQAYNEGRTRRASGQHIRVYSSSNEQVTPGDCIWDSETND